jgi:hypothetical protein
MKMNIFTFLLHKVNSRFYFRSAKMEVENVLNFDRDENDSDDKGRKENVEIVFLRTQARSEEN